MSDDGESLPAGHRIEQYVIERVLGVGGFGITYLAADTRLGMQVAIKEFLPTEVAIRDRGSVSVRARTGRYEDFTFGLRRFLDEARALARFNHPNIVRVLNFLEAHNTAYLVMDFVEGRSLADYLKSHKEPLTPAQLIGIAEPILRGLSVVHAGGFLHRDIKPGNIYLRREGEPLLIDFGAARQALGEQSRSVTGIVSAGYAPPEQYSTDAKKQGPWTDLYGLGATLYRCISGADPVDSLARREAQAEGEPDPLRPAVAVGRGRYTAELLALVDRLLALSPKQRPGSAEEVLKAVGALDPKQRQASGSVAEKPPPGARRSSANRVAEDDVVSPSEEKKETSQNMLGLIGWLSFGIFLIFNLARCESEPDSAGSQTASPSQAAAERAARRREAMSLIGEMVVIPRGSFTMGSPATEPDRYEDEGPQHSVQIAAFALGKTEVTFAQYDAFADATGRRRPDDAGSGRGNRPVINVSWDDATAYATWLSQQTGKKYRLPTEAEWEYAARAGSTTKYPWGDEPSHDFANYGKDACCDGLASGKDQWVNTAPVGSFAANAFGLHDMHGNVWEWVQDCPHSSYEGAPADGSAREQCDSSNRVLRGGSWLDIPAWMRSARRAGLTASSASNYVGFRLAQDLE